MDTGTNLSSNKEKKNEVGTTSIERPTNPTIRFRNRFKVNTRPDVDVEVRRERGCLFARPLPPESSLLL